MAATLSPSPYLTILDDSGEIIAGGKIFSYASGSSTPLALYHDAALTTAWTNPAVADAAGRITAYLLPASYKFEIATAAGVVFSTIDPVGSVPPTTISLDVDAVAGEALTAGDAVWMSDGSLGTTQGRWYKTDADFTASSTTASTVGMAVADIASAATGAVRLQGRVTGLSALTPGAVYYISATAGAITSSAPANARAIGQADTASSIVLSGAVLPPVASGSVAGIVSLVAQTLGAGIKNFSSQPTFTAGTGTGVAAISGVINVNVTPVGNVGGGTDDLMTYTIPANTLTANGKGLRVTLGGTFNDTSSSGTIIIRAVFGATTLVTTAALSAGTSGSWRIVADIYRTGAATQIAVTTMGLSTGIINTNSTPAETLSGTVIVKGVCASGVNNGDVIQTLMIVEALN